MGKSWRESVSVCGSIASRILREYSLWDVLIPLMYNHINEIGMESSSQMRRNNGNVS